MGGRASRWGVIWSGVGISFEGGSGNASFCRMQAERVAVDVLHGTVQPAWLKYTMSSALVWVTSMTISPLAGEIISGRSSSDGLGVDALNALASGDDLFQTTLGYLACVLVLGTFSMASMRGLRMLAIASNVAFIGYSWSLGLWPILMLHAILLPLNGIRLIQIEMANRTPISKIVRWECAGGSVGRVR